MSDSKPARDVWHPDGDENCPVCRPALRGPSEVSNASPMPSTLQEAMTIINPGGDRREAYGPVDESFNNIAKGWSVIFGTQVTGPQVALAMLWMKVCRETASHKRDNIVDLFGYTGLLGQLTGEE